MLTSEKKTNGLEYKLSDSVIGQISKLVQLAILTGTDIVDHMRMIRLCIDGDSIILTEQYEKMIEDHVSTMMKDALKIENAISE